MTNQSKRETHRRVTVYVPNEDWDKLRNKLTAQGVYSISQWVRGMIKRFLNEG